MAIVGGFDIHRRQVTFGYLVGLENLDSGRDLGFPSSNYAVRAENLVQIMRPGDIR